MSRVIFYLGAFVALLGVSLAEPFYPCPPFGLTRLPHSTVCNKFVQCFAGFAVEQECGPGLHYSKDAEKCVDESIAECHIGPCPLYNDPNNLVYLPDYLDCNKYYLCHNNEAYPYNCAEGLHWSEEREMCMSQAQANCVDYQITCRPNTIHQAPNPRFCNQYYYCLQGESFPSTCPGELLFDTITERCLFPREAECYEGSYIPNNN